MWRLLLLLLFLVDSGWAQCSVNSGPAGRTGCVDLSSMYTAGHYQWATCLTNAYIKQKSSHRHACVYRWATYCWYQCMLEVNNKESGDVSSDCSCNPNDKSPTKAPTALPVWCYSPSGNSCDWYRNCLEKKYPCEATTNAYALTYAEKFCKLYSDHYSKFTSDGRKWIDAVRKCLQVSLVPLLRPWYKPTCQQIRTTAFGSHTPCYLAPDKGAPSICDLKWTEYLKIFWTIKRSFVILDTLGETLKGMWNIASRCTVYRLNKLTMVTRLTVQKFITRPRRFADAIPESDLQQRYADRVSSAIAQSLNWDKKGMDWFGFIDKNTDKSDADISTINMILADTKSLGLNTNPSVDQVNLNDTIQHLAAAIKEGKLPLRVDGAYVWAKSLQYCGDSACNSTETIAESDTPPKWSASGGGNLCYSSVLVLSLLTFVLNILETRNQG